MTFWIGRTPKGEYVLSPWQMDAAYLQFVDSGEGKYSGVALCGTRKPYRWPKLDKGQCIPVALRAEGE